MTEQNALGTESRTAVIDNGSFGTREITFSTGRLAQQAAGSVIVRLGDTVVLSATTASKAPQEHFDFFPLALASRSGCTPRAASPARSSAARAAPARTRSSPAA